MEAHPNKKDESKDANAALTNPVASRNVSAFQPAVLSKEQVETFVRDGVLVLRAEEMWSKDELSRLLAAVDDIDTWPDTPGKWMKYYDQKLVKGEDGQAVEAQEKERILTRIENFVQYSKPMEEVLNSQKLLGMMSDALGEQAVLYKEKINYKLTGGVGFKPHQDVAAGWWMYGQTAHISVLVSVDEATPENGCLELVWGNHDRLLGPQWEEVPSDVVEKLEWKSLPTKPGDVVFFDSFVPHRSGPNLSQRRRRAIYATYAKKSEGDLRDRYYADKRVSFPPDCERDPSKNYAYKI